MDHREIRLLIMGMVVLALMVSCPDSGQVELGAVSSLSPADGTSTTDTTPTLSWDEVPDAAGYEVQLDDSKAELEASQIQSVTDAFYTPSSALVNGQTHYWRVRAVDGAGQKGTWSEIYSLSVNIGTVSGLGPANGATTTDTTPALSWDEVPDAAGYEIQLADSKAGLETSPAQSAADTSYTPSSPLVNEKTHYWRVRAVDGADQKGAWSAVYSLSVNIGTVSGLGPADGATTTDTTPTLSWDEVPDAAGYEIQLADSKAGLETSPAQSAADTSYTPSSALVNEKTHYWRVRAVDGADQKGAWSAAYSLSVNIGTVSGLSPADGSTTWKTTPTFSWTEVPGAAGYEVRLADSQTGLDSASSVSEAGTSYTPTSTLTIGQTYYWEVRAKDGADQFGAWSDANSLRVESDVISGLSPADGSTTWNTTPTFSWTEVPGAAGYEVRLADSQTELASASSVSEAGTSHTPTSALAIGQTHYWQVRAKDGADLFGPWSNANSLRVESDIVSGLSPADGSSTTDTAPTFSWTEVPGAVEYEVRIADSQNGLASALSARVTDNSHTPTSALTSGQTHYWQVRAKDGAGQFGAWSAAATIQIDYSIGDTGPAGGSVFYDKGSYSDGWRYLEAAPSDQGTGIPWGGHGTKVGGTTTGIGTGKANTEAIVTELGGGNYVAKLCYDLKLGGYDDWFLPSKDELNELYKQKTTIGGSFSGAYWSSSEDSSNNAWLQNFNDGHQTALIKFYDVISVRAVRAF